MSDVQSTPAWRRALARWIFALARMVDPQGGGGPNPKPPDQ